MLNRMIGRRAAATAVAAAIAGGALLAGTGAASAAPRPAVERAANISHSVSASSHGQWGDHLGHDYRWDRNHRWDGYRTWYRTGSSWYSNDHGRHYRYDGHRLYYSVHGTWIVVTSLPHGFGHPTFR
ncbi:hypothetical protein ACIRP2_19960 [Streptomyces sp. NPDC101194]|uniref:hypothetical protein n=1 Tax=Streptomyces sp. NPDC101194 TaxID=3366127 RepID=UPI0037FCB1E0